MEPPTSLPDRRRAPSVDQILATLAAADILETLEIDDDDDVRSVRTDSGLLETLTVAYELLMSFDDAGVIDTFFRLPKTDQANFLRWIGSTDDPETRIRRTDTFVSALEASPLEPRPVTREASSHQA